MSTAAVAVNMNLTDRGMEPLLKLEEAAKIIGRSHWTLRQDIKAGKIRCVRVGQRIMIAPAEVHRILTNGLKSDAKKTGASA